MSTQKPVGQEQEKAHLMNSQHECSPEKSLEKTPQDVIPEHNATASFEPQPEQQSERQLGQKQESGRTLISAPASALNSLMPTDQTNQAA